MVTQSLIDYIKAQLGQNVQAEAIKSALQTAGWQNEDIDSGFRAVEASTTILNLEVKPRRAEPRAVQQSGTGAWVKQEPAGSNSAQLASQRIQSDKQSLVIDQSKIQTTEPESKQESVIAVNQPLKEPVSDLNKLAVGEPDVVVVQPQKPIQQPREKELERKTRQKKIFRSAFNVLFGVCLGIGLTLGLQFVLGRLFINQPPEPSPSPIVQPSPLGISLADISYKNEELGIEVLYPSGWSRNLDLEGAGSGVKSVSFESGDLANIVVEIKQIDPLDKNISLEKVLEKSLAETKANHPDFVSLGQTKSSVSDLPAYVVDGGYSFQESLNLKMKVLQVALINESREFYVNMTLAAKEQDWQDYRPVYEQIVNSFKLTK